VAADEIEINRDAEGDHGETSRAIGELAQNSRIAQARLRTAGVGFLAPVGSNANDADRALNRRVELVAP